MWMHHLSPHTYLRHWLVTVSASSITRAGGHPASLDSTTAHQFCAFKSTDGLVPGPFVQDQVLEWVERWDLYRSHFFLTYVTSLFPWYTLYRPDNVQVGCYDLRVQVLVPFEVMGLVKIVQLAEVGSQGSDHFTIKTRGGRLQTFILQPPVPVAPIPSSSISAWRIETQALRSTFPASKELFPHAFYSVMYLVIYIIFCHRGSTFRSAPIAHVVTFPTPFVS